MSANIKIIVNIGYLWEEVWFTQCSFVIQSKIQMVYNKI